MIAEDNILQGSLQIPEWRPRAFVVAIPMGSGARRTYQAQGRLVVNVKEDRALTAY
jgi:hypothetical protein